MVWRYGGDEGCPHMVTVIHKAWVIQQHWQHMRCEGPAKVDEGHIVQCNIGNVYVTVPFTSRSAVWEKSWKCWWWEIWTELSLENSPLNSQDLYCKHFFTCIFTSSTRDIAYRPADTAERGLHWMGWDEHIFIIFKAISVVSIQWQCTAKNNMDF